jgi:RNA-directed DNA polymerase
MNSRHSTTGKPEKLGGDVKTLAEQWESIDWQHVKHEVNRLQTRIAKAQARRDANRVKRLQCLITHSYYAKAYAVKKVTSNKGKSTPGVDGSLWTTSAAKMKAVLSLTNQCYRSMPLRRVYIDKKGKKKKRPLGIPTMYDRAMQTLYALSLEPVAEVTADMRSFGFRKGRCAQDACEQAFSVLARIESATWVLEADIAACFDNISHDWLIDNIPVDKKVLRQFLKSGFVHNGELFPTRAGSPQGGSISSLLANITLDGIERLIQDQYHRSAGGNINSYQRGKAKVNLIRYADDLIATAKTKEIAEEVKGLISQFLNERGLSLSEEKTAITHINDGFDFLGWTFRKFKGKLIIKPSIKSVKALAGKLSEIILQEGKAHTQDTLIIRLNQVLQGWTNYHRHVVASQTFSLLDNAIYHKLDRWARRRHPNKGRRWIKDRYWHTRRGNNWRFMTQENLLMSAAAIPIIRHPKLKISKNPFLDPEYFQQRNVRAKSLRAARNGEEMLEPYERETLMSGS